MKNVFILFFVLSNDACVSFYPLNILNGACSDDECEKEIMCVFVLHDLWIWTAAKNCI